MIRSVSTAVLTVSFALILPGLAAAGPMDDAQTAFDAKDYGRALSLWRPLAERGNPDAQEKVGKLYLSGQGVAENDVEAVRWFRMAALKGQADAQDDLADCYAAGRGVTANPALANEWYAKAADRGNAAAQYQMGVITRTGADLPSVLFTAADWFHKAADQGHTGAQVNLAVMFAEGQGVSQDNVEALKWLDIAVENLPPSESGRRATLDKVRAALASKMTPAQIADAQLFAQHWTPSTN